MPKQAIVSCPQCSKEVVWNNDNPFRPFCSERCKMIDLGTWASEGYRLPADDQDNEGNPEESSGQA